MNNEQNIHIAMEVRKQIKEERDRQDKKWGIQNHSPEVWMLILGEEMGEVNKAVLEFKFGTEPLVNYRNELIQVAAVAQAAIECYDRNMAELSKQKEDK